MNKEMLIKTFEEYYGAGQQPVQCFFSPGRVNLIGEHIDYNGGCVFPAALSLGIYGAIRSREDGVVRLKSTNTSSAVSVNIQEPIVYKEEDGWGNYPKGVIAGLLSQGIFVKGYDILFSGNLPDGAGLSSSASILVLTAFMLRKAAGEEQIDRVELARFCQKVENQFINVNCGIMDQFSIAMGKKEYAMLLNCQSLEYKHIPLTLGDYRLVIMNTNKKRELADSKYNERRGECEAALALLKNHANLENLCQATISQVDMYLKEALLHKRARHVVTENARVLEAVRCLEQRDVIRFGQLMTQSHISLQKDYEVTGRELDNLVEFALKAKGCIGARMTGAGFGGCAIALVKKDDLEAFRITVKEGYQKAIGLTPDFYISEIGDGVNGLQ